MGEELLYNPRLTKDEVGLWLSKSKKFNRIILVFLFIHSIKMKISILGVFTIFRDRLISFVLFTIFKN